MTGNVDDFKAKTRKEVVEKLKRINGMNPSDEVRLLVVLRALGASKAQQREILKNNFEIATAWLDDFDFHDGAAWPRVWSMGGSNA